MTLPTEMTRIRKPADPFRADVLRGERSPLDGEVIVLACPNCGDTTVDPCRRCATYGAHGGRCHHVPAYDESTRPIGKGW